MFESKILQKLPVSSHLFLPKAAVPLGPGPALVAAFWHFGICGFGILVRNAGICLAFRTDLRVGILALSPL